MSLSKDQLQRIAAWHGLDTQSAGLRNDLVQVLEGLLSSGAVIEKALQRLRPGEREALERLLADGGRLPALVFLREYGTEPERLARSFSGPMEAALSSPAAELQNAGLVYRLYQTSGSWEGIFYLIPDDLKVQLPPIRKREFREMVPALDEPPYIVASGDILRDIATYLSYLEREAVRPVNGNRLGKRDLGRLLPEMSVQYRGPAPRNEDEAGHVFFVRHVSTLLGLSAVIGNRLAPTDKSLAWLKQSRQRQYAELWRAFQRDGVWNEWKRSLPDLVTNYANLSNTAQARVLIAGRIKECGAGHWHSVDDLIEALHAHNPTFLRQQRPAGYVSQWMYQTLTGPWRMIEAPFIRTVLAEPLAWLGIIEVGASGPGETITTFRITPVGANLLGLSREPIPELARERVTIQGNFEVLAPYNTPSPVMLQLQQIAEMRKRDRVTVFALTRDALLRAMENGARIENVLSFLEKASGHPLPQNVAYSLAEWAARFGEVTVEAVTLLTAADEPLLAELRANKKLALKVKREISPRAVDVDEDIAELGARLRKAGYLPKLDAASLAERGADDRNGMWLRAADLTLLLAAARLLMMRNGHTLAGRDLDNPVRKIERRLTQAAKRAEQELLREAIALDEDADADEDEPAPSGADDGGDQT